MDVAGEDEGVISPMSRNPQDMGHPRIFTGVWGAVEREKDQVFLEGLGLSDGLAVGAEDETGTVEDEAVISAHLIDHGNGDIFIFGDGGEHVAAELALADPKW